MKINCCYKCETREVGCHSTCEKYLDQKTQWNEQQELIKAKRNAEHEVLMAKINSIDRVSKKNHLKQV